MISVENLSFSYPDSDRKVLDDVSFHLERGQILGVIGPTGAGKSTLCRILAGFAPRFTGGTLAGALEIDNRNPAETAGYEMAKSVGLVFADYSSQLTQVRVIHEVMAPLLNQTVPEGEAYDRARYLLSQVGLAPDEIENRRTWELSGGQQQRIAIAAILAMQPAVIIFDSATGMLDPKTRQDVREIMVDLAGDTTIVVVEDDINQIVEIADQALILKDGKMMGYGKASELLRDHNLLAEAQVEIPIYTRVAQAVGISSAPLSLDELSQAADQIGPLPEPTADDDPSFGETVLRLENVAYEYEDGTRAIENANLEVRRGEVHTIVGGNGAGKSTLVKLMMGICKPLSGTVTVCGQPTTKAKVFNLANSIGAAQQNPDEQLSERTVLAEIKFPLERRQYRSTGWFSKEQRYSDGDIEQAAQRACDRIQLDEKLLEQDPTALPMGYRKLVAITASLALDPDIVVFDEPCVSLDAPSRQHLQALIFKLKEQGKAIILVNNAMDFACHVADTVSVIYDGQIAMQDSLHRVFAPENWEQLAQWSVCPPMAAQAAQRLGGRAISVKVVEAASTSLQEVA
ncbi:MAG: ABC transporter ATP-binding protein [Leptolyngbyaceae cyanobacterium]